MEEYFWLYDNSVLPKITAQLVDAVFSGRQPRGEVRHHRTKGPRCVRADKQPLLNSIFGSMWRIITRSFNLVD